MALISACRDCGNEFSSDKMRCPQCGTLRELCFGKIFVAIFIIAGIIILISLYNIFIGVSVLLAALAWTWLTIKKTEKEVLIRDALREKQESEQRIKQQNIDALIEKHIATLALKRRQLLVADEYGVVDSNAWLNEINRFYTSVLLSQAGECPNFIELIESRVSAYSNAAKVTEFSDAMSPYDYERYCANLLSDIGWNARATKASGDQGSDVIAEKKGVRIVLQCKLYTQPVGNKAIQEVFAAKSHEQAHYAAVVTNQTFTRSARQIATTTGVNLLHHDQIQSWAQSILK